MAKIFADEELDPRQGKAIPVGGQRLIIGNKATIARTVKRTPEVMVKIVSKAKERSAGKDMKSIKSMVNYISQGGEVKVYDESGNEFLGKGVAAADALDGWRRIPKTNGNKREALHIIFSMPRPANATDITPHEEVTEAVRRFARNEWVNYQYVYAQHSDKQHAHTHVILNMNPIKGGKRLNPRKADLQRWRERFAENLRELGIEANATPRAARGVTQKADNQAVRHINDRARQGGTMLAKVVISQEQQAIKEVIGKPRPDPYTPVILARRKQVLTEYAAVAKQLLDGNDDDKSLAADIVMFAQSLPPVQIKHKERVAELQQKGYGPEL